MSLLSLALLLAGCGSGDELMPLRVGRAWTYKVRTPSQDYVDTVRISRSLPVAGVQGYELTGAYGSSRLAWNGNQLLLQRLPEFNFNPPIVLIGAPTDGPSVPQTVVQRGESIKTNLKREQFPAAIETSGRNWNTTCSKLSFSIRSKQLTIATWFAPGVGIVRQEQSENGKLVVRLDLLSEY